MSIDVTSIRLLCTIHIVIILMPCRHLAVNLLVYGVVLNQ